MSDYSSEMLQVWIGSVNIFEICIIVDFPEHSGTDVLQWLSLQHALHWWLVVIELDEEYPLDYAVVCLPFVNFRLTLLSLSSGYISGPISVKLNRKPTWMLWVGDLQ